MPPEKVCIRCRKKFHGESEYCCECLDKLFKGDKSEFLESLHSHIRTHIWAAIGYGISSIRVNTYSMTGKVLRIGLENPLVLTSDDINEFVAISDEYEFWFSAENVRDLIQQEDETFVLYAEGGIMYTRKVI